MYQTTKEQIDSFLETTTRRELAEVLGFKYRILIYNLFILPEEIKYKEFEIKKKNGEYRKIIAPDSGIKLIQKRLSKILLEIYPSKSCVHGFVKSKSILTNAKRHINKKILINLDLQDFFPSINFGRVRGIFLSHPFNFNKTIATTLAQICCYKGVLPQGAPTSPIISNFICRKLDNEFIDISSKNKCTYTRYADDITISTNLKKLPTTIGVIKSNKLTISNKVAEIIDENGFKINYSKVRFSNKNNRQDVTGLIVNEKLNVNRKYIRNLRAILNAWEKYGLSKTAETHFTKDKSLIVKNNLEERFERRIIGKINFVKSIKGNQDEVYLKLANRIKVLSPKFKISQAAITALDDRLPNIYGEGKTDNKHLEAALRKLNLDGEFTNLKITFQKSNDGTGSNNISLLEFCENLSKGPPIINKVICIFDRDDEKILKQVVGDNLKYKNWGNNVFSMAIPVPPNRNFNEVCIEHYYLDSELATLDKNNRRLFLSTEFDDKTARHNIDDLNYNGSRKIYKKFPFIIDNSVYNKNRINVALSKDDFANNILKQEIGFDKFTFENFKLIFDLIYQISSS